MNVVVFADHEIGHRLLLRLLAPGNATNVTVKAVMTSPENGSLWWPGVEDIARAHGLPLLRYPVDSARLATFGAIDCFLLLSWKYVMPAELLALPAIGTVNLHYSLLPKYRGVYPVNWAIMKGEQETGVTYHWVTSRLDAGPVICQAALPIAAEDTARSLQVRLDDVAAGLFDAMIFEVAKTAKAPVGSAFTSAGYFSREAFDAASEIDLAATYRGREWLDLLRGQTFLPHARKAYFVDSATGRKIYVSVELKPGP